jgi:nucleotide-binding universal stress UspA family protein
METHTILVPTDFSTYAQHAWQEALAIATRDKAQVLLLHVLPPLPMPWADEWSLISWLHKTLESNKSLVGILRLSLERLPGQTRGLPVRELRREIQ